MVGADNASAAALSAEVSQALFVSSPAVVVASTGDQEGVRQGAEQAAELGIPMLLLPGAQSAGTEGSADDAAATSEGPDDSSQSAGPADLEVSVAEIERLEAETVLAMSPAAVEALDDAADVDIVTARDKYPSFRRGTVTVTWLFWCPATLRTPRRRQQARPPWHRPKQPVPRSSRWPGRICVPTQTPWSRWLTKVPRGCWPWVRSSDRPKP